MIAKARANARRAGFDNVEFRLGEIEHLPLPDGEADRVLSNCVLNLVPDKKAAYREMFRVLRPSGRFSLADIALEGEAPPAVREALGLYVGCVAGALSRTEMRAGLEEAGFSEVVFREQRPFPLSAGDIRPFLPSEADAVDALRAMRVYKVTVTGVKPG
jgi:SAM-dependent methyltransferase